MSHLVMFRNSTTPLTCESLPKGYSFTYFKGEEDIPAWLECCKNGLLPDEAGKEAFDFRITHHEFADAKKDIIFLDYNDEHIGTATAIFHPDTKFGELHMVSVRTESRGKGLVKLINAFAINKLIKEGATCIYLLTGENRRIAVKSYFSAGFLPVNTEDGMESRWKSFLPQLGISETDMLNLDKSFYKTIKP